MPTFDMQNTKTGEVEEFLISNSKKEEMIESGEWKQVHLTVAKDSLLTQSGGTLGKTSGDWRDLLKRVKKGSGRGNTVNTY